MGELEKVRSLFMKAHITELESQGGGEQPQLSPEKQARIDELNAQNFDFIDDIPTYQKGLIGIGKGALNVKRGFQDLGLRAGEFMGIEGAGDALDNLNQRIESEEAVWNELADRSTVANIGEVVGEMAALPFGGVAAGAGKFGLKTAGKFAAEGALIEGLTTRGGLEERAKAAGVGAAGNVVGGKLFDSVGNRLAKRSYIKANKADVTEDIYGAADRAAQKKVREAADAGDYQLPLADAYGDRDMLSEMHSLAGSDEGFAVRNLLSDNERKIREKASRLTTNTGGRVDIPKEEVAYDLAEELNTLRADDYFEASKKYGEWTKVAPEAQIPINTEGFLKGMPPELMNPELGEGAAANSIRSILKKYGVIQGKGTKLKPNTGVGVNGQLVRRNNSAEPLTAGNYEQMMQEINGAREKLGNDNANRLIGQVRAALDNHIDDAIGATDGIPREAVELGRAGRKAYRETSVKWGDEGVGEIVRKLTSNNNGSSIPDMDALTGLKKLSAPKHAADLASAKRILLEQPDGVGELTWNNVRVQPLADAFKAATAKTKKIADNGEILFDEVVFGKAINKLSEESKIIMFGEELTKELAAFVRAGKLRGKSVVNRGTTDGTVKWTQGLIYLAVRMAAPAGQGGQVAIGSLPLVTSLAAKLTRNKSAKIRLLDSDRIAKGLLTTSTIAKREAAVLKELQSAYAANPPELNKFLEWTAKALVRETADKMEGED